MATRNLLVNADTLFETTLGYPDGGAIAPSIYVGKDGVSGFYVWRAALKFILDWTGVVDINSAVLHFRTTGNWMGSAPTYQMRRATSAWAEAPAPGTAGPTDTTSGQVSGSLVGGAPGANQWYTADLTAIVKAWAPASIPGGGAQANNGIQIRSQNEASVSAAWSLATRESAYDAYIVLDYTSNVAPNTPSALSPGGNTIITGAVATPVLSFLYTDPDGNQSSAKQIQVSALADFSSLLWDSGKDAVVQNSGTTINTTSGTIITRGNTYYWRARAWDSHDAASPWSSGVNFRANFLPTAPLLTPNDATGKLAKMTMLAGSGWASPRMVVAWAYSDGHGQAQTQYELEIVTDNAGSPTGSTLVSGVVVSAAATATPSATYVENTRYHVRVRVYDGVEWSAWSGFFICNARWGLSTHAKDVNISGSAPSDWSVTGLNSTTIATNTLVIEYNSSDDGSTNLGAWKSTLALVTKRKWVHYRVWFFAWDTSPATRPMLLDLTIQASGFSAQPDFWLPSPISGEGGSIDRSKFAFGTQSLRMDGDGSQQLIREQVRIEPDTLYTFQARIESVGNSGADMRLSDTATGAAVFNLLPAPLAADASFAQYVAGPWLSGDRAAIWVQARINGATGTAAFFDAVMVEKGTVASGYRPSPLGSAPGVTGAPSVVDSGGVQIDAAAGGIFRVRGGSGGATDVVDIGTHGLVMDSDTWKAVSFAGAWVNYGGAYSNVAYRKDASGYVHLRGLMKDGTINTTAFTLPAGYRPAAQSLFTVNSNNAFGRVDITTAGVVTPAIGNNAWVALDGIIFMAEA